MSAAISNQQQVATTILHQLGGNKFIAMTGSHNFLATEAGLRMTLKNNKSRANFLYIDLCADDTYKMTFKKVSRKTFDIKIISEYEGVYCDSLQTIFKQVTGFYTSL